METLDIARVGICEENRSPEMVLRRDIFIPEGSNVVESVWGSLSKIISFRYLLSWQQISTYGFEPLLWRHTKWGQNP